MASNARLNDSLVSVRRTLPDGTLLYRVFVSFICTPMNETQNLGVEDSDHVLVNHTSFGNVLLAHSGL